MGYLADANTKFSGGIRDTVNGTTGEWKKSLKRVNGSLHKLSDILRHTSRSTRIVNEELADFSVELLEHSSSGGLLPCFAKESSGGYGSSKRKDGGDGMYIGSKSKGFRKWQACSNSLEFRAGMYEKYLALDGFPLSKTLLQDLPRTFGDLEPFNDPKSGIHGKLQNVLHAYSLHDPQVGYVQGMNLIAGFILLCSKEDELSCFWLFARMMQLPKYGLRRFFLPGMPRLLILGYQLEHLLSANLPRLNDHFRRLGVNTLQWYTPWALTLFACNMPFSMLEKVWDRFFEDGLAALLVTTVGILSCAEQRILLCDHDECLGFLKESMWTEVVDLSKVFDIADSIKFAHKDCDRLEMEYFVSNSGKTS